MNKIDSYMSIKFKLGLMTIIALSKEEEYKDKTLIQVIEELRMKEIFY